MSPAILLIAHGSRRSTANEELLQLVQNFRNRLPGVPIEPAFLELVEPDIPTGLANCLKQGASTIWMLPYFLSPGAHVTEDLEQHRNDFVSAHPGILCQICPPLGLHPLILEVLLDRLQEGGFDFSPKHPTNESQANQT